MTLADKQAELDKLFDELIEAHDALMEAANSYNHAASNTPGMPFPVRSLAEIDAYDLAVEQHHERYIQANEKLEQAKLARNKVVEKIKGILPERPFTFEHKGRIIEWRNFSHTGWFAKVEG